MLEFWGDVGFLVFTASTLIFTGIYFTLSSAWRKTMVGAIIGIFCVCVLILCAYLSLRIWDVNVPGVEWVRAILFWVLGGTMLTSIIGFLEVQFGKRGKNFRERSARKYDDLKK
jgi:hypothetical protein